MRQPFMAPTSTVMSGRLVNRAPVRPENPALLGSRPSVRPMIGAVNRPYTMVSARPVMRHGGGIGVPRRSQNLMLMPVRKLIINALVVGFGGFKCSKGCWEEAYVPVME